MKQLLLFMAMLPLASISAQDTAGVITYEQTVATNIDKDNIPEGLRNMIPAMSKNEMELLFTPKASLFRNKENQPENNVHELNEGNANIRIETKVPEDKYYTDLVTHKVTEQKDFMGRIFLLNHDASAIKWKFTGRQKKILGMPSAEAVSMEAGDTLTVWYTTGIPVSVGPMALSGLPGAVLEAFIGTNTHIVATKLEPLTDAVLHEIKEPKKGKKVDMADFRKIVADKEAEMRKQYGGNGNIIIMRQTR